MFWGQIGKNDPQNLETFDIFLVLALFSTCPSIKAGLPTLINLKFLELAKIEISFRKVGQFKLDNCKF